MKYQNGRGARTGAKGRRTVRRVSFVLVVAAGLAAAITLALRGGSERIRSTQPSTVASPAPTGGRGELSALRARFPKMLPPVVASDDSFSLISGAATASVTLPPDASGPVRLADTGTGMSLEVRLRGTRAAPAEPVDGYIVYRDAIADGATLLRRVLSTGIEDFVSFAAPPSKPKLPMTSNFPRPSRGCGSLRMLSNCSTRMASHGCASLRRTSSAQTGRRQKPRSQSIGVRSTKARPHLGGVQSPLRVTKCARCG
jgi:hypothetical protein